jgi:hypothetical protein
MLHVHFFNTTLEPVPVTTTCADETVTQDLDPDDRFELDLEQCTYALVGSVDPLQAHVVVDLVVTNEGDEPIALVLGAEDGDMRLDPEITCHVSTYGYVEIRRLALE